MYQILLVDDEALIREQVSENVQWEKYGYELAGSCENGKEALDFIDKTPVDVVLTDICMPFLDGMELSEKLSVNYPNIKIIILSGYDEFEYAKKAIRYGVKEYLLKPITASELGDVLCGLKEEMDKERDAEKNFSQMKVNYHKGQMLVYSDVLLNLITGSQSESESRRELDEVGVSLEASVYRVAVVELDIYAETDKLDEKLKKESALMAFVLYNISQELVTRFEGGEVCQGKDHRTFILFHSNARSEFKQSSERICSNIIDQMNRLMQLSVNIGLGDCVYAMKDIYKSYEGAEEALDYHYVLGANCVIGRDVVRNEKRKVDIEKQIDFIMLHTRENDPGKLEESLHELEDILRDAMYDRRNAEIILQRIIDEVDGLRKRYGTGDSISWMQKEKIIEEVLSAGKLEEAVEKLCDYCEDTGEKLESCKNVNGRKYAVQALDYMERNYADCELSLQSVCSYLNISTSRFSSIFKTVTGTTFMDSLSKLRMQKARELLENTDLRNYEIAEKVGYNDPHYFSIAFKKTIGKSPTEYAKEMRK